MSVTVDQILKLYVAGLLEGAGTSGDPIILSDLPTNTVLGDLGGGTGAITLDQLKTALNISGGGTGNAGVRPLNLIVSDGNDLIDLEQWAFDYWQIDLNAVSSTTLSITNPLTTAVPLIHLHFINMLGDVDVTFPSDMKDANGDALGTHTFSQGQIIPFYYAAGNYYTNYLSLQGGGGGGGTITQDGTGVAISSTSGSNTTLFSLIAGAGMDIHLSGNTITFSNTSSSFGAEYQAILDQAGTSGYALPGTLTRQAQNTLVEGLKSGGFWNRIKLMYVFTHDVALDEFSNLNWKDPSQFEGTLHQNTAATLTYTAEGIGNTGAGAALDTNYDVSADAPGDIDTNHMVFMAVSDEIATPMWGVTDQGDYQWYMSRDSTDSNYKVWDFFLNFMVTPFNTDIPIGASSNNVPMAFGRSGDIHKTYLDGAKVGEYDTTAATPSDTIVAGNLYLAGRNNIYDSNNAVGQVMPGKIRFWMIMDSVTDQEADDISTLFSNYLAAL